MEEEKISSLLGKILEASRKNKIEWEKKIQNQNLLLGRKLHINTIHILGSKNNLSL